MEKKSRVFLPQEPARWHQGAWVPAVDIRPVLEYGTPVVCLPPGRMILSPAPTTMALREKLADFTDNDYLVAIGDPSLIATAAAIVSHVNRGKFRLLKWDKDRAGYIVVEIDINQRLGAHRG